MGSAIFLVVMVLEHSRVWLEMRAVHDDETAAGLVGLNTTIIKVGAFGFGAAVAAVSGGLFAHHHVYIEPGNFGFERSIDFVLAVILGGSTVAWERWSARCCWSCCPNSCASSPTGDWRPSAHC